MPRTNPGPDGWCRLSQHPDTVNPVGRGSPRHRRGNQGPAEPRVYARSDVFAVQTLPHFTVMPHFEGTTRMIFDPADVTE